jgi:hypothetical protein
MTIPHAVSPPRGQGAASRRRVARGHATNQPPASALSAGGRTPSSPTTAHRAPGGLSPCHPATRRQGIESTLRPTTQARLAHRSRAVRIVVSACMAHPVELHRNDREQCSKATSGRQDRRHQCSLPAEARHHRRCIERRRDRPPDRMALARGTIAPATTGPSPVLCSRAARDRARRGDGARGGTAWQDDRASAARW